MTFTHHKFIAILAFASACGLAQAQGPVRAPAVTNTEINALKIEMQQLRSDFDVMKEHIFRIVQFLKQHEEQGTLPQGQAQPQARAPQAGAGFNPAPARVSIAGAPTLGRADAPVTIVEFSDFECPFCQRFFASTLPEIKRDYVDTGKLRYVFLDLPLEQIHFKARKAAEAAHCAAEQGKFWEMHDVLFLQKGNLEVSQYGDFAKQLGLEAFSFDVCLGSGRQSAKINSSVASARALGIKVTPSFIIARTEPGDTVSVGGHVITGAQSYDQFRAVIEQVLGGK